MKHGRSICNTLKKIRLDIARANDIDYVPAQCSHKGECAGTCPACESEVEFLEKEISRKRSIGKAVLIAGVGLTSLAAMAGKPSKTTMPIDNGIPSQVCDTVYRLSGSASHMPSFLGGDGAMWRFISEHIVYPEEAYKNHIEGKVVVQFFIEKTGKVGEVKVIRSVNEDLDREAVRVIKLLSDFSPARNAVGEPVGVWYTMPVTFKLKNNDSEVTE